MLVRAKTNRSFQKKEPPHEGLSAKNILNNLLYVWAKYIWVVIRWAAEVVGQCCSSARLGGELAGCLGPNLASRNFPTWLP